MSSNHVSPGAGREDASLGRLEAVARARHARLGQQRAALRQREKALAATLAQQSHDEALLAEQRALWAQAWRAWSRDGGPLQRAQALRDERALHDDMTALLAQRRRGIERQAERLAADWRDWRAKQAALQALDDALAQRQRALRIALLRGVERRRDEDALLAHGGRLPGAAAPGLR